MNAQSLEGDWDVIIVHDPQPVGLRHNAPERAEAVDLALPHRPLDAEPRHARPDPAADPRVRRHASGTCSSTCPTALDGDGCEIVPPAIDPLSPKNMALSPEDAAFVCEQFGIDVERPLICQVSRFDPWKDPIGRDRRLPDGRRGDAGGPAGAGRLDGDRRPRGLGVLPPDLPATPTATPTSRSSTTSTTSARSRSTRSSRRPTS